MSDFIINYIFIVAGLVLFLVTVTILKALYRAQNMTNLPTYSKELEGSDVAHKIDSMKRRQINNLLDD